MRVRALATVGILIHRRLVILRAGDERDDVPRQVFEHHRNKLIDIDNEPPRPALSPPPRIFAETTVFILGGGASLAAVPVEDLPPGQCIAVNFALERKPDAMVALWRDNYFRTLGFELLKQSPGLLVTRRCELIIRDLLPGRVIWFYEQAREALGAPGTLGGSNSGWNAIDFALQTGANRIVLLGFDGCAQDGRFNFHQHYKPGRGGHHLYPTKWNPGMADLEMLRRDKYPGTEIVNCSLESAVTAFRKQRLEDILTHEFG